MTKKIISRFAVVFLILALSVAYCMSLNKERYRTSVNTMSGDVTPRLGNGDVLTQKLVIDEGEQQLCGVALFFSESVINPEGKVNVQVLMDGTSVGEWSRKGQFIKTTECEYFLFDSPKSCQGHQFEVKIGFEGFIDEKPFSFKTGLFNENANADINGESINSTVCCLNVYDEVPVWQMVTVPLLIFLGFAVWQLIYYFLIKPRFKIGADGDFASVYIALLLVYFLMVPMHTVPDEEYHFLRSYSIAHGSLITDVLPGNNQGGDVLPAGVADFAERWSLNGNHNGQRQNDRPIKDLHADRNNCREVVFTNTAINVPYMYSPQILGIKVSEIFTDDPYYMAYCSRFVNMVIIATMVLLAVRFTPSGKEYFKFTALLPIMLQENVSLAPDGFITALVMLYIALILHLRFRHKGGLTRMHYMLVFILTIAVVMCKLVYAPICLLLFLVPSSKFGSRSRFGLTVTVFALSIVTMLLSWLMLVSRYNLRFHYSNSSMQIDYMLSEPRKALGVFANYLTASGRNISELLGGNLGCTNIPVPFAILLVFAVIASILCYRAVISAKSSMYAGRMIPLIIVFIVYMLIGLSEYLGWTKVGAGSIEGIVGRYYLPIAPLLFFAITGIDENKPVSENGREKMSFAIVLSDLFAIVTYWIYCVY